MMRATLLLALLFVVSAIGPIPGAFLSGDRPGVRAAEVSGPPSLPTSNLFVHWDYDDADGNDTGNSAYLDGEIMPDIVNKGSGGPDMNHGTTSWTTGNLAKDCIGTKDCGSYRFAGATSLGNSTTDFAFMHDDSDFAAYFVVRRMYLSEGDTGTFVSTSIGHGTQEGFLVRYTAGDEIQARVHSRNGSTATVDLSSTSSVTVGEWSIVAFTHADGAAGDDYALYVNGTLVDSGEPSGAVGGATDPQSQAIRIGSLTSNTSTEECGCQIQRALFYKEHHDAGQVSSVMAALEAEYGSSFPMAGPTCTRDGSHMCDTADNCLVSMAGNSQVESAYLAYGEQVSGQLARLLGTDCYTVNNVALGGSTISGHIFINQWETRIDTRHDVWFAAGGINDINGDGDDSATLEADLDALYDDVIAQGNANVVLVAIAPFGNAAAWSSAKQTVVDDTNTYIAAQTSRTGDWRFLDLYALTEDPSNADELLPAYDWGDGLHFNATAQAAIAGWAKTVMEGGTP